VPPAPGGKKKGVPLIAKIFIGLGIGLALIVGAIILVISLVGGSLKKTAEADYYEIGSDTVPSVKFILGEVREVNSVNTSTGSGVTTKAIGYNVSKNQGAEMEEYAMALMGSHGFYSINDFDFSGSTGKGFEFSRESDEKGLIIILTIDYDSKGYTITLARGEGTLTTPAPTPEPTPEPTPKPEPEETPEPVETPDSDEIDFAAGKLPGDGGTARVSGPTILEFTPVYEGIWVIHSKDNGDDDPALLLRNPDGSGVQSDDDSMGDRNARLYIYLFPGTTYTVEVYFYDPLTDLYDGWGEATVFAKPPDYIPPEGGESMITAPLAFLFIPDKTGIYEFYTSDNGTGDPYLELYDSEINLLASDDDSAGDLNALISIELTAGEAYHLFASFMGIGPIDYVLHVDKK